MKVWIQSADYSDMEYDLGVEDALKLFHAHDWDAELREQARLSVNGEDCCPPGMGFVYGDGHILHVCPGNNDAIVHYLYPSKFLGFLWRTDRKLTKEAVPHDRIDKLVRSFFSGNWVEVENNV